LTAMSELHAGSKFYSPLRTQIIEFPTFVQTVKWTRDLAEGRANNEEMSFNTKEGMNVYADVSLSYAIEPAKVPDFYVKYRVNELEYFTHGILRDVVRNSLNEVASTFTVEDIYGERKAEFLTKVQVMIQSKMTPVGVGIQQFGFIGAPRVPEVIATSITAKARAIQEAERARNELATTQAEAAKKIAEAEGDAQSAINRAKGEAEYNRIRLASLTPQMLELRKLENQRALIEKWNGQLPTVESQGSGSGAVVAVAEAVAGGWRTAAQSRRNKKRRGKGHDLSCPYGEGKFKVGLLLLVDVVFRFQALQQRLKKCFGGIWGGADGLSHFFGGGWKVAGVG